MKIFDLAAMIGLLPVSPPPAHQWFKPEPGKRKASKASKKKRKRTQKARKKNR